MIEAKPSPVQQAWANFDAWWKFQTRRKHLSGLQKYKNYLPAPISDDEHLWVSEDRVWYPRERRIIETINALWADGVLKKAGARNHGVQVEAGYREVENPSAQIVVHKFCIEMDFDLHSPIRDLVSLIKHAGEVIKPGATDPYKVAEGLRKRGVLK